jgi:phytoene synthase
MPDVSSFTPMMALAFAPVPPAPRAALEALAAFDREMGAILASTREPLVGQMRLTWWREAVTALDHAPPPAQPVLQALAGAVIPAGVTGASLARIIDGWEMLLREPLDRDAVASFAEARGGGLFAAMAGVLGASDPRLEEAGQGWALADLARHVSDPRIGDLAAALSAERVDAALATPWSRAGRPLAALAGEIGQCPAIGYARGSLRRCCDCARPAADPVIAAGCRAPRGC